MRSKVDTLIKLHYKKVLIIILSIILCYILAKYIGPKSDYTVFVNITFGVLALLMICRSIYTLNYKGIGFKTFIIATLFISTNHLYSYVEITKSINWIKHNSLLCLIGFFAVVCLFVVIWFLRSLKHNTIESVESKEKTVGPYSNINNEADKNGADKKGTLQRQSYSNKSLVPLFKVFGIILFITTIVFISIWLFFKLDIPSITNNKMDSDLSLLLSTILSNGATLIVIIFGILLVLIALVELVRFIFRRVWLFKEDENPKPEKSSDTLTHVISILIVVAMLFFSYKVSNFSLDDFTENASSGKYIALPLFILLGIVAFLLLVRLTHGVLSLIIKTEPINIGKFVKENDNILGIKRTIIKITRSCVEIIMGSIESALSFVEFIPDFFSDLQFMVLSDDEELIDEDEEY